MVAKEVSSSGTPTRQTCSTATSGNVGVIRRVSVTVRTVGFGPLVGPFAGSAFALFPNGIPGTRPTGSKHPSSISALLPMCIRFVVRMSLRAMGFGALFLRPLRLEMSVVKNGHRGKMGRIDANLVLADVVQFMAGRDSVPKAQVDGPMRGRPFPIKVGNAVPARHGATPVPATRQWVNDPIMQLPAARATGDLRYAHGGLQ